MFCSPGWLKCTDSSGYQQIPVMPHRLFSVSMRPTLEIPLVGRKPVTSGDAELTVVLGHQD